MSQPVKKQSTFEGARRPWNVAQERVRKGPYLFKEDPAEIRTCLSCPLPDCQPAYCPLLRDARKLARVRGVPQDFRIRLDLGDSTDTLAKRYSVSRRTVSLWKQQVRAEDAERNERKKHL